MIESFHDHSLDVSLLKPGCKILDVGCYGFDFGDQLRQRFQANVYECDLNDLTDIGDKTFNRKYYRLGIAHYNGYGRMYNDPEPQCRFLVSGTDLQVYTIEDFGKFVGVPFWDAVKLDCEGAEYAILSSLKRPPATQLTVEFHQHTQARQSEEYIAKLVAHLGQWYDVRQHRLYEAQGSGLNYWDSLFVLKGAALPEDQTLVSI